MSMPALHGIGQRLAIAAFALLSCAASAADTGFSFAVIAPPVGAASAEPVLRAAISETDSDNLAFVVVNGLKTLQEPCSDTLYAQRAGLLNSAKNGLVVSLAAGDWSLCRGTDSNFSALERLTRLRELLFTDNFSLGASRIPVIRQAANLKFRSYVENARWEIGRIMFATINLPANNNDYRLEAGRNSEFEDRLVANRDWLHRVFAYADREKQDGIVLFCDGDPLAPPLPATKRDGFAETRRLIEKLAANYRGKVLVVHGHGTKPVPQGTGIIWRKNIGNLDAGTGWVKVEVNPAHRSLFTLKAEVIAFGKRR